MHLTQEVMDAWAKKAAPNHYLVRLEAGERIPWSSRSHPSRYFEGPTVVELISMRDGGWEVYEARVETPESIALTAGQ